MSQALLQIGLVFGIIQIANKFELEKPENAIYFRISYTAVQVINLLLLGYIYYRIKQKNDKTALVYNESKNPFDPKEVDVIQTTVQDYDISQTRTMLFQTLMAMGIVGFMHFRMGYLRPLLLQSVMGFRTVMSAPLFKVHILGQTASGDLARPWKSATSFGQTPSTPKELKAKERKEAKKKLNRVD